VRSIDPGNFLSSKRKSAQAEEHPSDSSQSGLNKNGRAREARQVLQLLPEEEHRNTPQLQRKHRSPSRDLVGEGIRDWTVQAAVVLPNTGTMEDRAARE